MARKAARRNEGAESGEELTDRWEIRDGTAIRHHRTPRTKMWIPRGLGAKPGYKIKDQRETQVIYRDSGTMVEMSDNWRTEGEKELPGTWTGWAEFEYEEEGDYTGPFGNRPNANTERFKRKAEDPGDEERLEVTADPVRDEDQEMNEEGASVNEMRKGLTMMDFDINVVDWLFSGDPMMSEHVNEIRRLTRLYGKRAASCTSAHHGSILASESYLHRRKDGADTRTSHGPNDVR